MARSMVTTARPGPARGTLQRRVALLVGALPRYYITILTALAVLLAWEVLVRALAVPRFLMPSPSLIWAALTRFGAILLNDTWITLSETVLGFVAGSAMGVLLAILIVFSRVLERMLYPPAIITQMVPKLAIAPLFVIWFGIGLPPKIMVILIVCLFPVMINTVAGMRSVDPRMLELMYSVNASRWQVFRKIEFPTSLPYLFAGLKIAITMAVTGAVVAEWLGSNAGLGHQILMANSQLSTDLLFASLVMLSLTGMGLFGVVAILEAVLAPRQRQINVLERVS